MHFDKIQSDKLDKFNVILLGYGAIVANDGYVNGAFYIVEKDLTIDEANYLLNRLKYLTTEVY
jgi:hypothetical protein